MTAAFVTLENDSDSEVTLVSASTPASDMVELHEMVMNDDDEMVMQRRRAAFRSLRTSMPISSPVATTSCSWT